MDISTVVRIISSAAAAGLIILVLLHSPKGDGIGGIGGQAQLFTSAKSAEKTLNRVTWTLFVVFVGLTVVLSANWLGTYPGALPTGSPPLNTPTVPTDGTAVPAPSAPQAPAESQQPATNPVPDELSTPETPQ